MNLFILLFMIISAKTDLPKIIPLPTGVSTISITASKQINRVCYSGEMKVECHTKTFTNAHLTCDFYDLQNFYNLRSNQSRPKPLITQENVLECRVKTNDLTLPISLLVIVHNIEDVPVNVEIKTDRNL